MDEFEPKIVGFCCRWCAASAADLAGVSRIEYPSNIRIIRVMCSGAVDPLYVIRALLEGADGVLIAGCHPGDCHYTNGNYRARRRMAVLTSVLKDLGLEEERVRVEWIGADEGKTFAKTVKNMRDELKKLGPNRIGRRWSV